MDERRSRHLHFQHREIIDPGRLLDGRNQGSDLWILDCLDFMPPGLLCLGRRQGGRRGDHPGRSSECGGAVDHELRHHELVDTHLSRYGLTRSVNPTDSTTPLPQAKTALPEAQPGAKRLASGALASRPSKLSVLKRFARFRRRFGWLWVLAPVSLVVTLDAGRR